MPVFNPFPKSKQVPKKKVASALDTNPKVSERKQWPVKRKPINPISKKQLKELAKRRKLKAELIEESGGLCMRCGKPPDMKDGWGELHLIHKIALSQGGKTNRKNCAVWCRKCHLKFYHHLRESDDTT